MFTVILLSEAAKSIFEPARVYFAPFVEDGQIAFCDWDESSRAQTLSEAAPGLPDITKGKANWRALVVDHPRASGETAGLRDPENPFDFKDSFSSMLNLEASEHALVRLSHMLLGYPQMTVKRFRPYLRYEHADTGEVVEGDPVQLLEDFLAEYGATDASTLAENSDTTERDGSAGNAERQFLRAATAIGQVHNNIRRLFKEVEYSEEEQAKYAELQERYRMNGVRPASMMCVATRAAIDEDEKALLRRAWQTETEHNSSRFSERNDYPPATRFATYELLEEENAGYEHDLLRFWLSVLTLATNVVPHGAFQSERLYMLGVDFCEDGLAGMLNEHISDLAMVRDHLEYLIRARPPLPSMEVRDLLSPIETAVVFDDLGGGDLEASDRGYGLASDKPRSEFGRWMGEIAVIASRATTFMRRPRRAVARAVVNARELVQAQDSSSITLNEFERDELEEVLAAQLRDLVVPSTTQLLDKRRIQRVISAADGRVRSHIRKRMRAATIVIASVVCMGVWSASFVPYVLQARRMGAEYLGESVLVALLTMAIIGGVGLVALLVFRAQLLRRIQNFNSTIRGEVALVRSAGVQFAGYLSQFVTYRRGTELLRDAQKSSDVRADRHHDLLMLREQIVRQIADEKEIVRELGAALQLHQSPRDFSSFDPHDHNSVESVFRFPEGVTLVPFNESGVTVCAPYEFVTRLTLHRVSIFESERNSHRPQQLAAVSDGVE